MPLNQNKSQIEALDKISALGLPSSYDNIQKLNSIIQLRTTQEQKKAAIRLLGQQYTSSQDETIKNFARSSLLKNLNFQSNHDRGVQESIILTYSRLDYFDDSLGILKKGHDAGIIDNDKYYGDMAHLSIMAPRESRNHIFKEILKSKNNYSAEILTSYVSIDSSLIDRQNAGTIINILKENEPVFDDDKSTVGALQLVRYATWLKAFANAHQIETGQPAAKFIEDQLSKNGQDPRKLLAWIMEAGQENNFRIGNNSNFQRKLQEVISSEYKKYPNNEFYSEAMNRIKGKF